MPDQYYLTDGGHVLISGATGAKDEYGGKTTTANWWFEQSVEQGHHDVGVFFNPKGHSSIRGRSVSSLKGLAQSYRSGNRLIDVRCGQDDALVGAVIEMLKQLPGEKIVVVDEAQMFSDVDQVDWMLAQGGNLDKGSFRALVLTQRPWSMSEQKRMNMPLKVWVGPITSEGRKFFQVEQMREVADRLADEIKPYHWAVTDGGEFQHVNPPVPAEYA